MCITNRWLKHVSNKMQYIHSFMGLTVMMTSLGSIAALIVIDDLYLNAKHAIPGFLLTFSSIV